MLFVDLHLIKKSEETKGDVEEDEALTDSLETVVKLSEESFDTALPLHTDSQTTIFEVITEKSDSTVHVDLDCESPTPPDLTDQCNLSNDKVVSPVVVKTGAAAVMEQEEVADVEPELLPIKGMSDSS